MRIGLRPKAHEWRRPADRGLGRDLDQRRGGQRPRAARAGRRRRRRDPQAVVPRSAVRRALFRGRRRPSPRQHRRRLRHRDRDPDRTSGRDRRHVPSGDRVRIFGDVTVREDEAVSGQVVAVLGSVRVDGEVGDQVVAVLGFGGSRGQGGRARRHHQRRRAGAAGAGAQIRGGGDGGVARRTRDQRAARAMARRARRAVVRSAGWAPSRG